MDYIYEANVTLSHQFHNNIVSHAELVDALGSAIHAMQRLDRIKKALFYGKDTGLPQPREGFEVDIVGDDNRTIAHALIGLSTEAGELLEPLYAFVTGMSSNFDGVNIVEETGDVMWYLAVLAKVQKFSFDDAASANIAKLRARYKDKFDAYEANNRDLENERATLQGTAVCGKTGRTLPMVPQQPGAFDPLPYPTSGEHIKGVTASEGIASILYQHP